MLITAGAAALVAVIALILAGCSPAGRPNRSPLGELFPTVRGKALDRTAWTLPGDLKGRPAILLVGYVQDAQFDIDRWMLGLLQAGTPTPFFELPTVKGLVPGLFAEQIDEGMRSGIPKENWGGVITVYSDAASITGLTGTQRPRNARVLLLDASARVVWFHDRGYSPTVLLELDKAARGLTPQTGG